ncbi:MAG: zf-HC2 domain-containing protein [Candidatus Dormibacteraeota bacterium]|nr:zf-HC2 domain-containing protein [Candidatus Dormibacteraeota bacterium]
MSPENPTAECGWARRLLEELADGGLPSETQVAVLAHVAACPDCRVAHIEAVSLPARLRALPTPAPPPDLLDSVLRRVGPQPRFLEVWGLLAAEAGLMALAVWYVSGLSGLLAVGGRTLGEVGDVLGWGSGQGTLPQPTAQDAVLLLMAAALAAVALWHLSLLARPSRRRT